MKTYCCQNTMDAMRWSFQEAEIQTQAGFFALQGEPCKCHSCHLQRNVSSPLTSDLKKKVSQTGKLKPKHLDL